MIKLNILPSITALNVCPKAICVCRNPADKPVSPAQPDPPTNWQSICCLFSCLQRDKTRPCIVPLCPTSSSLCYLWCWAGLRSARWWWTGGASGQCLCVVSTPCRPPPVPASAAAAPPGFSARKPDWTVGPSRYGSLLLIYLCDTFFVMHNTRFTYSVIIYERLILTSLSPWRLRNTSSWLSPCAGDESETGTERR